MKKFIIAIFLGFCLLLGGCTVDNNKSIPEVAFKGTQVEDLVDKPDRELMRKAPPKQYLKDGMNNGDVGVTISNNNLRAASIERRLDDLQQYVCNLFKDSAGEACDKQSK